MNKWLIYVLDFAVGAIAGALADRWIRNRKKQAPMLAEKTQPEAAPDPVQTTVEVPEETIDHVMAEREHPEEDLPEAEEIANWNLQVDIEEPEEEDEEERPFPDQEVLRPEVITEEQYIDSYRAYDKDEWLYFEDVDELTFGDEDRIEDPVRYLGRRPYDLFQAAGGETVCVRIHALATDVLITKKGGTPYWYEGGES